jgi:hypothetical protein
LVALVEVVFPLLAMLTVLLSFAANRNSGGGR